MDGVGTKKIAIYITTKVGNISNNFGIGIDNVVVWRLSITAHGALLLNAIHIVDESGIIYNATYNIVKVIQGK